MKTSLKIASGVFVGGLIITGILLTQTGLAYGRWGQERANSISKSSISQLAFIPATSLSDAEKLALAYQYREEMVARDLYTYFSTLYGEAVFKKIAESEQKHMDAVKVLLDRYGLPVPVGYAELQTPFDELKTSGSISLQSALEVGLKVEMLDIEDIAKTIKMTDNEDLRIVFANIGGASYNHLRGFSKALASHKYVSSVDISQYLSTDEIQSRGSLQYKLSEDLREEGINVSSKSPVKKNSDGRHSHGGNMRGAR